MTTGCPGEASLRGFLEREGDQLDAEAIEKHVSNCDACQALLDLWTDLPSEFQSWLTGLDDANHDETPVGRLLDDRIRSALLKCNAQTSHDKDDERPCLDRVGPYRIQRRSGAGGMGIVFEAVDTRLGRRVALKMILGSAEGSGPVPVDRFRREGAVLAALNHPNIVPVYEVGEHNGQPYLVLEFVPGGTLSQRAGGRPLPPREAARVVGTLAGAVQYAHEQGVIHRDLKPGNILLKPTPGSSVGGETDDRPPIGGEWLMIADFGLARWRRDLAELTRSGQPVGTPAYMAPEQAAGLGEGIGPAVDIYALGVILYELLTGRPPFQAETIASTLRMVQESDALSPRTLQPGVPRDLETITLKCLDKDPRRRYASAGALAADLDRFLEHRSIVARPIRPAGRAWRWCRRNPGFAAVLAITAALLVALVVGSISFAIVQADLRRQTELRERQARQNAADARAARDLASLSLQRALTGYSSVVDGVLAISPFDNPKVRSVQDTGHRILSEWCVEYLDSLQPGVAWTIADIQVALTLARVRYDLDQESEAEPLLSEAWEAARRLGGFDQSDSRAIQLLAVSSMRLGNTLNQKGRQSDAIKSYELSDRLLVDLLRADPGESYYLNMRFGLLGNLASTLARLGRVEEAIQAEREGIRMLEALVETHPGDSNHPIELGLRAARVGRLHLDSGQWEDAWSTLSTALEQLELVPADSPRINEVRKAQINGLRARARAGYHLGRLEAVVPDLERALSMTRNPRERWELQIQSIEARVRVGILDGAVDDAEALLADTEAVTAYPLEIANVFALLAGDPSLPPPAHELLKEKVVQLIKTAQSTGRLNDPDVIKELFVAPDLAPLRSLLNSPQ
ncbi:serine/threonine-protein kinase [Tautonia marina]|uniref:serine/threonine-protein kinase n=1 Tax=Tautonia marina TaxID=2653855 RepID=UPI001260DDF5|nr:serine/threonine-protein kinase [Tautonia marina]